VLTRAPAEAGLAGDHMDTRRLAHAAGRLCQEVASFWPRDSWKPIANHRAVPPPNGSRGDHPGHDTRTSCLGEGAPLLVPAG
jgi:hypothetical protein